MDPEEWQTTRSRRGHRKNRRVERRFLARAREIAVAPTRCLLYDQWNQAYEPLQEPVRSSDPDFNEETDVWYRVRGTGLARDVQVLPRNVYEAHEFLCFPSYEKTEFLVVDSVTGLGQGHNVYVCLRQV